MSFQTDPSHVAPCNRNNCRCGDDNNCMYYNSAGPGQGHYNVTAVQGAGSPDSAAYQCSSKAYDYYNARTMYADHALSGMGTYAEEQGANQQAGSVDFRNEQHGKRDMCDKNFLNMPDLSQIMRPHQSLFGFSKTIWLLFASVVIFWLYTTGRLNLSDRRTQVILAATLVAFVFFFR